MVHPAGINSTIANTHHLLSSLTALFLVNCLLLSLFIVGVAANVIVCITLTRGCRLKRHLSNFMLFHLSVTDMVYRLIVLPSYLIATILPVESKDLICKISQTLLSLVHAAIFTSLVVIALDRHHAITKPFQRLRQTKFLDMHYGGLGIFHRLRFSAHIHRKDHYIHWVKQHLLQSPGSQYNRYLPCVRASIYF